jgi:flagellar hook-associated protein 3 FlgL
VRITSETMVMRSLDRLQSRLSSYERAQSELSTGRRILQPSDDPSGAGRAMSLRSALRAREQEVRNAGDATGWLNAADSQLQTVMGRLARVQELTTVGASSGDAATKGALAKEIREIAAEIEGIANTRHLDRPLFGGFGDADAVQKVGGAWITNGDGDEVKRRVSDTEHVRVNVTASDWMVTGGENLLGTLDKLATDLEAGQNVGGHLSAIQAASRTVADSLAQVGAATNRVDSAKARAMDLSLTLRTELSDVEDVDIAQGVMELQVQQVGYEATLQAIGRALPPSLVAFLR